MRVILLCSQAFEVPLQRSTGGIRLLLAPEAGGQNGDTYPDLERHKSCPLRLWLLSQTPGTGGQVRCRNLASITQRFIFSHDFPTAGLKRKRGESQSRSLRCSWVHVLCPSIPLCLFHTHTQGHLALNLSLPRTFPPSCSTAQLSTDPLVSGVACV